MGTQGKLVTSLNLFGKIRETGAVLESFLYFLSTVI